MVYCVALPAKIGCHIRHALRDFADCCPSCTVGNSLDSWGTFKTEARRLSCRVQQLSLSGTVCLLFAKVTVTQNPATTH